MIDSLSTERFVMSEPFALELPEHCFKDPQIYKFDRITLKGHIIAFTHIEKDITNSMPVTITHIMAWHRLATRRRNPNLQNGLVGRRSQLNRMNQGEGLHALRVGRTSSL